MAARGGGGQHPGARRAAGSGTNDTEQCAAAPAPRGDLNASDHADEDEPDPLDRLLDEYSAQATAEAAASLARQQQRERRAAPRPAAARREEALAAPLAASNKGFALMAKMGFEPGRGLGRDKQGRSDPLPLVLKSGRAGLGVEEGKQQRKREAERRALEAAAKRQRHVSAMQSGFKGARADAYAARKLRHAAARAAAACASLDERAGVAGNPLIDGVGGGGAGGGAGGGGAAGAAEDEEGGEWELLPGAGCCGVGGGGRAARLERGEEAAAEGEAGAGDGDGTAAVTLGDLSVDEVRARLAALVDYLRSRYFYCVFCGAEYEDEEDLARSCPGPREEDHDD